jgi:hypothetical protein
MRGRVLWEREYRGHRWRLEVTEHQGRTFGNWRKWYDVGGTWKPTREGCTFPLESLWELTASLMAHHDLKPPQEPLKGS